MRRFVWQGFLRHVALLAEGVGRNQPGGGALLPGVMSPSSRRAWVEIQWWPQFWHTHMESPSSRRAWVEMGLRWIWGSWATVALLAEGVGRNLIRETISSSPSTSPSSRRAWVEMRAIGHPVSVSQVALLAEGVGRNYDAPEPGGNSGQVALLAEGVGRNLRTA